MFRKIFQWIRDNYFSAQFALNYEFTTTNSWERIQDNFRAAQVSSTHQQFLFGIGTASISISHEQPPIGYRGSYTYTFSEITMQNGRVCIFISASGDNYFELLIRVWKGIVFIITIVVLLSSIISLFQHSFKPDFLIGYLVLLIFNAICWITTCHLKSESKSMFLTLYNIVEH